ncbi:MAG: TetR/AcrR family transcriptional regulator [Arachnia sp.]
MSPRGEALQRVLDATAALIPELGWGNVSARLIAGRAGVSLGVVHYYAHSVDELRRRAALRSVRAYFEAAMHSVLAPGTTSLRQGLAGVFDALTAGDPHRPELLLLYETLVAAPRDPELRDELAALVAQLRTRLSEWFAAQGVADPDQMAALTAASIDGYLLQRCLDPGLSPAPVAAGLAAALG